MTPVLFDIEANGFLEEVTKIHCIVAKDLATNEVNRFYQKVGYGIENKLGDYEVRSAHHLFDSATHLIGHNIIGYDNDLLKRFLGVHIEGKTIIDTLVWSQTLNPDRKLPAGCPTSVLNPVTGRLDKITPHSVAAWGYRVARAKPAHYDWLNFSPEMLFRCEEDVGIQELIFDALLEEARLTREEVLV